MMDHIFAVSAPGLEPYTAQEIHHLGLLPGAQRANLRTITSDRARITEEGGGIEFEGDLSVIYRLNLHLRTASRVLVRFAEFNAVSFPELRKKASRLSWERYLQPGQRAALRVTCHKSRLYHSDAVAERVAGAIGDRLGAPVEMVKYDEGGAPPLPQLFVVRLVNDHCTISVDSSGAGLHRRGYRLASARAPLRETLAAGVLLASGWDVKSSLLDPFCGSGTIPIEAAMMARRLAPGRSRRFAFMDWPGFDLQLWESLLAEADQQRVDSGDSSARIEILASDRDAGAVQMSIANAERAGVKDAIMFSRRAVSAIEPPSQGWMVTNPPYGMRVSRSKDLRNLYAQLGNVLRRQCQGWHFAFLCNDPRLYHQLGFEVNDELALVNGGVHVRLVRGAVPSA
ncbi:MAG: hypothetical protein JXB15_10215 [Anaerolineales bacterium]|nr:hypothetical protein [Anaerolineales bacterium]